MTIITLGEEMVLNRFYFFTLILVNLNLLAFACLDDAHVFHSINLSEKVTIDGLSRSPIKNTFLINKGGLHVDKFLPREIDLLKVRYMEASNSVKEFEQQFQEKGFSLSPLVSLVNEKRSRELFRTVKSHTEDNSWESADQENCLVESMGGNGSAVCFIREEAEVGTAEDWYLSLKKFGKKVYPSLGLNKEQQEYLSGLYKEMFKLLEGTSETYILKNIILRWNDRLPLFMINAPNLHYDDGTDLEGNPVRQMSAVLPILNNGPETFKIKGKDVFIEVGKEAHMSIHNENILHRSPFARGQRMALILFFEEKI